MQTFDPDLILSRPLMAHLGTLAPDGAPRIVPVWFLWEDGALWMLADEGNSTVARLAADARCAVEITDLDLATGRLLHCGLRGTASVEPNDPARFRRLLTRYLGDAAGWNPWFISTVARIEAPEGRFIRLVPDSIFTNNVSYFRTGPALAWP